MEEGEIIGITDQGNIVRTLGRALDQAVRKGLRQIIADALDLEISGYQEPCRHAMMPDGHRLVRRSGALPERDPVAAIVPIRVKQSRVRDGQKGRTVTRDILPPYSRWLQGWMP